MRLVDLHCNWLLQYAGESTLFGPDVADFASPRRRRLDGYLQGVSVAVLVCARSPADWAAQSDRGQALGTLITRYEAEFAGRLLFGPDDFDRRDESLRRGGLCYGVLGLGGVDQIVREPADAGLLEGLFERGVRVFQLVNGSGGLVNGSGGPLAGARDEDRGLSSLGRECLARLAALAPQASGPRPILDLAGMSPVAIRETLGWISEHSDRVDRLPVMYGRATPGDRFLGDSESLTALRAVGGVVGIAPPSLESGADALKSAIDRVAQTPFLGQSGCRGIAVGADLFGAESVPPGLANVARVLNWLTKTFDRETALELAQGAGSRILRRGGGGTGSDRT